MANEKESSRELQGLIARFPSKIWRFLERAWNLGVSEPKKFIHCLKVGLALSFVSLFYYMRPLHDGVGRNAMWAIMTVVVVFEYTVGRYPSWGTPFMSSSSFFELYHTCLFSSFVHVKTTVNLILNSPGKVQLRFLNLILWYQVQRYTNALIEQLQLFLLDLWALVFIGWPVNLEKNLSP